MPAFILTDDTAAELAAVECATASMLPEATAPQFWLEVPTPVSENTVALVDGAVVPAARARSEAKQLELVKSSKKQQIKDARNIAEFGPFAWDGSRFDADPIARSRIQGAVQLAHIALISSQSFSVEWTLADNTARTLDAVQMLSVGQALGAHVEAAHIKARGLKAQVDAAGSVAEVELITWM